MNYSMGLPDVNYSIRPIGGPGAETPVIISVHIHAVLYVLQIGEESLNEVI